MDEDTTPSSGRSDVGATDSEAEAESGQGSSTSGDASAAPVEEVESTGVTPEDDGRAIGATLGLFEGDRGSRRRSSTAGGSNRGNRLTDGGSGVSGPSASVADVPWLVDADVGIGDGEGDVGSSGGVVAALAAELRTGSASDDDLAALRQALGVRTASDDVRIEHLQARVGEFAAYAEELRTVIDEHGTADAFVDRLGDRIDGLRADLDAVEAELSALREEVDAGRGRNAEAIERLERRVEAVESVPEEFAAVFEDLDAGSD